ncbi:MAG: hypothetical protein KME45_20200 [Stenomitos rutilans HA7619-LM2]|nr:hypothetical protein [Stenomitos rutilans HA7619-LM2]
MVDRRLGCSQVLCSQASALSGMIENLPQGFWENLFIGVTTAVKQRQTAQTCQCKKVLVK